MQRPPPVPNPDYEVWGSCVFASSLLAGEGWPELGTCSIYPVCSSEAASGQPLNFPRSRDKAGRGKPLLPVLRQGVRSRAAASRALCTLPEPHCPCSPCCHLLRDCVGQDPGVVCGGVKKDSQTNVSAVPPAHPERPAGGVCGAGIQALLKTHGRWAGKQQQRAARFRPARYRLPRAC